MLSGTGVLAVLGRGPVDPSAPVVPADDPGVIRGDGCFEGIRVVPVGPGEVLADNLDRHLARFARSAAALEIPFDAAGWQGLVGQACAAWAATPEAAAGDGAMKLVLTRGVARPLGWCRIVPADPDYPRQRRDGIRVVTLTRGFAADAFSAAPWLLGGIKTLSYAVNMAAQREAARRGADDVIFVDATGAVLEAPTASVIWVGGPGERCLRTVPVADTGILAGTTQDRLFAAAGAAGWDVRETPARVDDLHAAHAVWVISAVRGPVEVVELDGRPRPRQPHLTAEITRLAGF